MPRLKRVRDPRDLFVEPGTPRLFPEGTEIDCGDIDDSGKELPEDRIAEMRAASMRLDDGKSPAEVQAQVESIKAKLKLLGYEEPDNPVITHEARTMDGRVYLIKGREYAECGKLDPIFYEHRCRVIFHTETNHLHVAEHLGIVFSWSD